MIDKDSRNAFAIARTDVTLVPIDQKMNKIVEYLFSNILWFRGIKV